MTNQYRPRAWFLSNSGFYPHIKAVFRIRRSGSGSVFWQVGMRIRIWIPTKILSNINLNFHIFLLKFIVGSVPNQPQMLKMLFYRIEEIESSLAGPFIYDNRKFQRNWFTKFERSGSRIRIRDPGSRSGFFSTGIRIRIRSETDRIRNTVLKRGGQITIRIGKIST